MVMVVWIVVFIPMIVVLMTVGAVIDRIVRAMADTCGLRSDDTGT